jgi:putative transposase
VSGNRPARFGKRPTEKDPHHGNLAGGLLHSEGGSQKPTGPKTGRALRPDPYTYVRTWTGMVYVAFVVDVYAQRIVGWHAMSTRPAELVLIPLRMAAWARGQQGHLVVRGALVHHSDAGSQGGFKRSSQHLDDGGVLWRRGRCGRGRVRVARPVADGSGWRIVRCGRRCARRDGRSRRVRCSGRSGG